MGRDRQEAKEGEDEATAEERQWLEMAAAKKRAFAPEGFFSS